MFVTANLTASTLPDPPCHFCWAAPLPAGPAGICLGSLLVTFGWSWALCAPGLVPGLENILGSVEELDCGGHGAPLGGLHALQCQPGAQPAWALCLLRLLPPSATGCLRGEQRAGS